MEQQRIGTKTLAVAGMMLAWFPVVATVVATAAGWLIDGRIRLDYLMPAELAPSAIVGGTLLFWAALRAHSRRAMIGWGVGIMLLLLVGGQLLAEVTGLASGAIQPAGWPWLLVLASLVGYVLALVETGIAGVLLVRDVFRRPERSAVGSNSLEG
jgi:hypothetical protein